MLPNCWPIKILLVVLSVLVNVTGLTTHSLAEESNNFAGSWVANGTSERFAFGENRTYALFKLQGHVNLKSPIVEHTDYWSECSGLSDSDTGSDVRCVWRSLNGEELYLVLEAEKMGEGSSVRGTFVGGTGSAHGIKGEIYFQWSTLLFQKSTGQTTIGGYAKDMKGSYTLPLP